MSWQACCINVFMLSTHPNAPVLASVVSRELVPGEDHEERDDAAAACGCPSALGLHMILCSEIVSLQVYSGPSAQQAWAARSVAAVSAVRLCSEDMTACNGRQVLTCAPQLLTSPRLVCRRSSNRAAAAAECARWPRQSAWQPPPGPGRL